MIARAKRPRDDDGGEDDAAGSSSTDAKCVASCFNASA